MKSNFGNKFNNPQEFGNTLRDEILHRQLEHEVGAFLDKEETATKIKVQLKSKAGDVLGDPLLLPKGGAGDDFLKNIIESIGSTEQTSSKSSDSNDEETQDTSVIRGIVDLGYSDPAGDSELYGCRAVFKVTTKEYYSYFIRLIHHIKKLYYVEGTVRNMKADPVPGDTVCIPWSTVPVYWGNDIISPVKIKAGKSSSTATDPRNEVLAFTISNDEGGPITSSSAYRFELYFVFSCYGEIEDIGDIVIEEIDSRVYRDLSYYSTNCNIKVTDSSGYQEILPGIDQLIEGRTYQVDFTPNQHYKLSTCTFNGVDILNELENNSYRFECGGNVNIIAEASIRKYITIDNIEGLPLSLIGGKSGDVASEDIITTLQWGDDPWTLYEDSSEYENYDYFYFKIARDDAIHYDNPVPIYATFTGIYKEESTGSNVVLEALGPTPVPLQYSHYSYITICPPQSEGDNFDARRLWVFGDSGITSGIITIRAEGNVDDKIVLQFKGPVENPYTHTLEEGVISGIWVPYTSRRSLEDIYGNVYTKDIGNQIFISDYENGEVYLPTAEYGIKEFEPFTLTGLIDPRRDDAEYDYYYEVSTIRVNSLTDVNIYNLTRVNKSVDQYYDLIINTTNCTCDVYKYPLDPFDPVSSLPITPGRDKLEKGSEYLLIITPTPGYSINSVRVNNEDITTQPSKTFIANTDITITAIAQQDSPTPPIKLYSMEINTDNGCSASVSNSQGEVISEGADVISEGEEYTLYIEAEEGYEITSAVVINETAMTELNRDEFYGFKFIAAGDITIMVGASEEEPPQEINPPFIGTNALGSENCDIEIEDRSSDINIICYDIYIQANNYSYIYAVEKNTYSDITNVNIKQLLLDQTGDSIEDFNYLDIKVKARDRYNNTSDFSNTLNICKLTLIDSTESGIRYLKLFKDEEEVADYSKFTADLDTVNIFMPAFKNFYIGLSPWNSMYGLACQYKGKYHSEEEVGDFTPIFTYSSSIPYIDGGRQGYLLGITSDDIEWYFSPQNHVIIKIMNQ